ncbi:hypothetical protein V7097_25390 [Bacillus sp. JJ1562]
MFGRCMQLCLLQTSIILTDKGQLLKEIIHDMKVWDHDGDKPLLEPYLDACYDEPYHR